MLSSSKTAYWDHPRRCGENVYNELLRQDDEGSPPQVRGKRLTVECNEKTDRITPAGAGKTLRPFLIL